MPDAELPSGRYFTCTWEIGPDGGGQSRVLLMRNRMLREAGHEPWILSFVAVPDLDERRAALCEQGQLLPGMTLQSIFDHYREHDWLDVPPTGKPLPSMHHPVVGEELRSDGTPWRIVYMRHRTNTLVYDYLRSDGSTFLRVAGFNLRDPLSWPGVIQPVSRAGEALKRFTSLGQWFRGWVSELAQDDPAFVFVETRVLTPHLVPMKASNIHLIQVMHNVHTQAPHEWNSSVAPMGQMLLDRMDDLDAVVNLTERQHDDIKLRRGATNNLFVVPNPVTMPDKPASRTRDPRLVTIVARLTPQKRLTHAIDAFEKVLTEVPDARLEIFGSGPDEPMLRALVEKRGLSGSVVLRGWDPDARQALEGSTAFLMTSRVEGYPLATLESMSHGCPVVSYDIKYGPRDQITDGVDGFLVPDRDTSAMAERVVRLLRSPELVSRMSSAAVAKAEQHSSARFAADWAHVLQSVVRQKASRTTIVSTELEVTRLRVGRPGVMGRWTHPGVGSVPGVYDDDAPLSFRGVLRLRGSGPEEALEGARVELFAVHDCSGDVVELPISVSRQGRSFAVSAEARLGDLMGSTAAADSVQLRLRLVWGNSARDTVVTRSMAESAGVGVAFLADGSLALQRLTVPPDRTPADGAQSSA